MSKPIFDVLYVDYDWRDHHFLEGPENTSIEEFQKLCNKLIPKAAYCALMKHSSLNNKRSPNIWISWRDVVEALVSLLEKQGYQRVNLPSFTIEDAGYIIGVDSKENEINDSLGFCKHLISQYNQERHQKYQEEQRLKRMSIPKTPVQIIK